MFGNDRVMLYNVDPWHRYGFGVPNFGENVGSVSKPIANLVDEVGRSQLFIMLANTDSQRTQPPSRNTVERMGRVCNRVKSVLAGRQKESNALLLEPGHASPDTEIFRIHPTPYFRGPIVRNHWMQEYNSLCMMALANMMQHSDNNIALTITATFAKHAWQYFREIQFLIGRELLNIPRATLEAEDFQFTNEHYEAYAPEGVTLNYEALDTPGPIFSLATEDDVRPLFEGIPATLIKPLLRQYPVGLVPGADGLAGVELPDSEAAVGTTGNPPAIGPETLGRGAPGSAVAAPGGGRDPDVIGRPSV